MQRVALPTTVPQSAEPCKKLSSTRRSTRRLRPPVAARATDVETTRARWAGHALYAERPDGREHASKGPLARRRLDPAARRLGVSRKDRSTEPRFML